MAKIVSGMAVADLRAALADLDGSLPVLLEGGLDHSFLSPRKCHVCSVAFSRHGYAEWYGKENASQGEEETLALVLV